MDIALDRFIGNQQLWLASGQPSGTAIPGEKKSPFAAPGSQNILSERQAETSQDTITIRPRGTREFAIKNPDVAIGNSGVTVTVADLSISPSETDVIAGGRKYRLPSFARMGSATVTGSSGNDEISVKQDSEGNTVVEVFHAGKTSAINLGKIASLSIDAGAGDDEINIDTSDFYGGISVTGGAGEDEITVNAKRTLTRGVTIYGGEGDDVITISGEALAILLFGGGGDDEMDAQGVGAEKDLTRTISGDAGNDIIYSGKGKETISGGAGQDLIIAGGGDDTISGGAGNDVIYGGDGADKINGDEGDDFLNGGNGADSIGGDGGNDVLIGGSGGDTLAGGEGDDSLYGGSSDDDFPTRTATGRVGSSGGYNYLIGGEGTDTFAPSSPSPSNLVAYSGTGSYLLDYNAGVDILV